MPSIGTGSSAVKKRSARSTCGNHDPTGGGGDATLKMFCADTKHYHSQRLNLGTNLVKKISLGQGVWAPRPKSPIAQQRR